MNDELGAALTPDGSPWSVTLTEPLNPFCGATETVTVELTLPITAEAETGETAKLKSCIGGGGGWLLPPHADSVSESASIPSDSEIALEVNRVLISGHVRATRNPKSLYTSSAVPVDSIVDVTAL